MDREAKKIRSQMFTSNEFVYATPKFVNENSVAIIVSMRGTPETCVAAQVAKDHGASTIGLYVEESDLTEICDYKVHYDSIMFDESDQSQTNAALGVRIAMDIVDVMEGYENYDDAMAAFDILDEVYNDAKEYCLPLAEKWAETNKNEHIISVLASGPAYAAGYIFSICNIMEMLQIQSPTINSLSLIHIFFRATGGGVTLSGGEPLCQPEFAAQTASILKKDGIHVALDTCLYAPWDHLRQVLAAGGPTAHKGRYQAPHGFHLFSECLRSAQQTPADRGARPQTG